jgi:DNA polymerase
MHNLLPLHALTAANVLFGQHVLHRDYETRSRAVLKTIGAARYAAELTTEVLCCAYAIDNDPVQLWRPGDPVPSEFVVAAQNPNSIVAAFNESRSRSWRRATAGR